MKSVNRLRELTPLIESAHNGRHLHLDHQETSWCCVARLLDVIKVA
jgi:hypothetical protein